MSGCYLPSPTEPHTHREDVQGEEVYIGGCFVSSWGNPGSHQVGDLFSKFMYLEDVHTPTHPKLILSVSTSVKRSECPSRPLRRLRPSSLRVPTLSMTTRPPSNQVILSHTPFVSSRPVLLCSCSFRLYRSHRNMYLVIRPFFMFD